jgi:transcriptional regulator with XRE-family HTH domain
MDVDKVERMINLQAIREAAGLSRRDIGDRLGFNERTGRITVAQIEGRQDWLLSSLAAYLKAAGAIGELTVKINGEEFLFPIA